MSIVIVNIKFTRQQFRPSHSGPLPHSPIHHPQDQLLKHYIVLSRQAALKKYLPRVFSSEDLERGWHRNRVSIQADALEAYFDGRGTEGKLHCLSSPEATDVDRSSPQSTHFWEWSAT